MFEKQGMTTIQHGRHVYIEQTISLAVGKTEYQCMLPYEGMQLNLTLWLQLANQSAQKSCLIGTFG